MSGRESEVSDKLGYKVKHLYPDWQLGVNEQPGRATLCLLRVYFSDWQASSPRLLLAQHEVILHACRGRTLWGKWDKTMLSNCLLRNEHTDVKTNIKTWMVPFKELTQTLGQTTVGRRELTNLNVSSVRSPMKIHSTYLSTETKYTRHSNESVGRNVRIKRRNLKGEIENMWFLSFRSPWCHKKRKSSQSSQHAQQLALFLTFGLMAFKVNPIYS